VSTAELSSLATALGEITARLTAIADSYAAAERDEVASELYGVERALAAASRRLARIVHSQPL
jgi:hypothetical protein